MHIIDETQCTLEETSLDNGTAMVSSQLLVCSFDKVKEWYVSNKVPYANPNPKSNDALYFGEQESFFIEFKNGRITDTVNYEINKKIYDSLFILFDLEYIDKNGRVVNSITYTRNNMTYILVYNEEHYAQTRQTRQTEIGIERQKEKSKSQHRDALYKAVRELAKEEFILFGLDQFKNYLFKNVYTYTEKEFVQKFVNCQEN